MPSRRLTLPNLLSYLRLALVPVLWLIALTGDSRLLGALLLVAYITDVIDGPIARRNKQVTSEGSRLDTVADIVLSSSAAIWLLMFQPDVLTDNVVLMGMGMVAFLVFIAVGWLKFRRFANLHLYTTKASTVVFSLFVVHALITGQYNPLFFTITAGIGIIAALEGTLIFLTRDSVDEHIGTILNRPN